MKKIFLFITCFTLIAVPMIPAPALAECCPPDPCVAGPQVFYAATDLAGGQFMRGVKASGEIIKKNPVLQFPLFAIPTALVKGATYQVASPINAIDRFVAVDKGKPMKWWATSKNAKTFADHPATGILVGAAVGGPVGAAAGAATGAITATATAATTAAVNSLE